MSWECLIARAGGAFVICLFVFIGHSLYEMGRTDKQWDDWFGRKGRKD